MIVCHATCNGFCDSRKRLTAHDASEMTLDNERHGRHGRVKAARAFRDAAFEFAMASSEVEFCLK